MRNHEPLQLERFLPYRLSILSNQVSQEIAAEYRDAYNLAMPEWRVMAVLARFDSLTASDIVQRTAMDKVTVSRATSKLVAAHRVDRHPHPADKRRSVLQLSEEGWRIHQAVAPRAREHEKRLLATLSQAEVATLAQILDKLAPVPDAVETT